MALKDDCQAALDAFKSIVSGNVSSGSSVLTTIYEEPTDVAITPPVLMLFDEGLDPHRPPGQWRMVLWDWRLQLFVQKGDLSSSMQQCRDMRADLIDLIDTHLTLNGTCQVASWKIVPKIVKLSWSGVDYSGVDGILTVRMDRAFTFAS